MLYFMIVIIYEKLANDVEYTERKPSHHSTSNVKDMEEMFSGCSGLVDLSCLNGWDVSNVENMNDMFKDCDSIESYPEWYVE